MFKDNPLTGVGTGEFSNANGAKYWPGPRPKLWLNAHSLYIQLLAELGLVGVLAFTFFLVTLFRLNRRLSQQLASVADCPSWMRQFPTACMLTLLVLLFAGYSSHNLYRSTWYMVAALTASLQLILARGDLKGAHAQHKVQLAELSYAAQGRPEPTG